VCYGVMQPAGVLCRPGTRDHLGRIARLDEPRETLLACLAYGADCRRPLSGAEIATYTASPHGKPQILHADSASPCPSLSVWKRRPALRYATGYLLASSYLLGYIQRAIAGTVFIQIGIPIVTGADDVEILALNSGGKATRAGRIAILVFVSDQTRYQKPGQIDVRIEVIATGFRFAQQPLMQSLDMHRGCFLLVHLPTAFLMSASL